MHLYLRVLILNQHTLKDTDDYACCLKRITLLPGSHALLIAGVTKFPKEFEVLLGADTQFYITKDTILNLNTNDVCIQIGTGKTGKKGKGKPGRSTLIKVTDVVVVK